MKQKDKKIYLPVSGKNTNLWSSEGRGLAIPKREKTSREGLRVAVHLRDDGHAPRFRAGDRIHCDPEAKPKAGDDVLIVVQLAHPKAATLIRINRKSYVVERGGDRLRIPRASLIRLHPIREMDVVRAEAAD